MEPYSIADLIRDALDSRAEAINTCMPAKVLSYDAATQTATVRPALKRPVRTEDEDPTTEALPDIPSVPVVCFRGGPFVLHLPPVSGDYVLLLFPQWSIAEWRRLGGDSVDPGDHRHHSLGSCVALHGVYPSSSVVAGLSPTEVLLGKVSGPNVKVTETKVKIGSNGPYKKAARVGDPVRVTIPTGTTFTGTVAGNPATFTVGAPIVVDGVVGPSGGSAAVDISD